MKLNVSDLDRSIAFYTGLLGMRVVARVETSERGVVEVPIQDLDGTTLFVLIHRRAQHSDSSADRPSSNPSPITWPEDFGGMVVFHVQGLDQLAHDIATAGYEILLGPMSAPRSQEFAGLRVLVVRDPDGYPVEILEGDISAWSKR